MPLPRPARIGLALTAAALLGTPALLTTSAVAAAPAAPSAVAGANVVRMFPTQQLTVADPTQLTGRRVNLPTKNCGTDCATIALLNQLDGFDLDPRISVTFDRAVDPAQAAAAIRLAPVNDPGAAEGVDQVVYDPASHTVYAHPDHQLAERTVYRMSVQGSTAFTVFPTESATAGLLAMRQQIDNGSAFKVAGIPAAARGLQIDAAVSRDALTGLTYVQDEGSGGLVPVPLDLREVPQNAGTIVFGHFQAPSWITADSVIPQTPTAGTGPKVLASATLPFILIEPKGAAPAGGWPVAIFGHGFTRSDADVFPAAQVDAAAGIATIATDVVGHGYGPRSTWQITAGGVTTTIPAYARGHAPAGQPIGSTSGVSPAPQPAPLASINDRDSLRQTVADNMTLVRAIGLGTASGAHPGGVSGLKPTGVTYFGQSFGGIYGTMIGGVDPKVQTLALNVDGGPITEIARLAPAFRPLTTLDLQGRGLLNSADPAVDYFVESLPLRGQPPVTNPAPGALAIQQVLAEETWLDRSGDPTAYAPLLRQSPPRGSTAKNVLFQNAFGDQTVPNPTNYNVLDAGGLFDRESLYRNDKNTAIDPLTGQPFSKENPHGFLLNLVNPASIEGQTQIATLFLTGQIINPDPSLWEVPINDPAELLPLNFPAPWDGQ